MSERKDATHRLLNSGRPALVQHWPALGVVDLEPQREADGSDVICRVLQQTNISDDVSIGTRVPRANAASVCHFCTRPNSRKHGRGVCSRWLGPCELGAPAGSACGSCRQTTPARTASCRPAWRTPRGLRRQVGRTVSAGRFSLQPFTEEEISDSVIPKLVLWGPGERDTVVKQAVAFRQADSLPPL